MPTCNNCGKSYPDFAELAKHISANKKSHKRGRVWAANYLLKTRSLNNKREQTGGKVKLTDEQKIHKLETRRELSGFIERTIATCCHCKRNHRVELEAEYTRSHDAWKLGERLVRLCGSCGG